MTAKKYRVVYYIKVEPDKLVDTPMTSAEAIQERNHLESLQPENIYRIEEIK